MRARIAALAAVLVTVGCTRMAIDGVVTDVAGEPIPGAMVSAVGGAQCQQATDASGAFSLVCKPAHYELHIGKHGYIPQVIEDFDASERKRYDIGSQALIKIPSSTGLTRFKGNEYVRMDRALLQRRSASGSSGYRHYCLDEKAGAVTQVAAGMQPFFDYESGGWKAFRLDDEGCAYRMSPDPAGKGKWRVDYADKPEVETRQLEHGKEIVIMKLTPGRYFIADWERGFFTKGRLPDDGPEGYLGYYLEAVK